MRIFISHNKADLITARAIALLLVEQGLDVWFDEWEIRPGDSIVGGLEKGLAESDVFLLIWSAKADESKWVGAESRAFIARRVQNAALRIIPVMLDDTPLPALVGEFRGFHIKPDTDLRAITEEIAGTPPDIEVAKRLQKRLIELNARNADPADRFPFLVCPSCASEELKRREIYDPYRDNQFHMIECKECGWGDWTQ